MFLRVKSFVRKQKERRKLAKRNISVAPHAEFLNNVKLGDYVYLAHHVEISNSDIGLRTSVGRYTKIQYAYIGKYCSISWDVTIGAIEHPLHSVSSHAFSYRKQFGLCEKDIQIDHKYVEIGNDVWIGGGNMECCTI